MLNELIEQQTLKIDIPELTDAAASSTSVNT